MVQNRRITPDMLILALLLLAPVSATLFFSFKDKVVAAAQTEVPARAAQPSDKVVALWRESPVAPPREAEAK